MAESDDELCGRMLGDFLLGEKFDGGGFGNVYRCEQRSLARAAVVKVLHARYRRDSDSARRFLREAQLASRLGTHPYAAHIYAFGAEPDGLLWIAMELVEGLTLTRWLEERGPLPLAQLVPFFECVAEVVQTAHDLGIVHRDLKPANVMVIERAGRLLPKLLDFGIAKLLETVAEVADNQPQPRVAEVDSDEPLPGVVYADDEPGPAVAYADDDLGPAVAYADDDLGPAVAYADDDLGPVVADADSDAEYPDAQVGELAAGSSSEASRRGTRPRTRPTVKLPYRRRSERLSASNDPVGSPPYMSPEQWLTPRAVGPAADLYAVGVIAYESLTGKRPFAARAVAHCRQAVPPLGAGFPPSLNRFFRRALAKRPKDRWGSALELARALRAELDAQPHEQVRRSAAQWAAAERPTSLLLRSGAIAALDRTTSGVALSDVEMSFVAASRRYARRNRVAVGALAAAAVLGVLLYRATLHAELADELVTQSEVEQGRQALLHDELGDARQHLGEAWRRGDRESATAFMLARALQPARAELARLPATFGRMWSATFSPDGRRIVTSDDKAAQIWDAETYQRLFTLPHGNAVYQAVWSADGARIATATDDGHVRLWDAARGVLLREMIVVGERPHYYLVALSPDGTHVAAITIDGDVSHVWDAETGARLVELRSAGPAPASIAFSADGRWLAISAGEDVRVFDTTTWSRATTIPGPRVRAFSFDPSGTRIATGSLNGDAAVWSLPSGEVTRQLRTGGDPIDALAFAPNGRLVVTASRDGTEQLWDATTGRLRSQVNSLRSRVLSLAFDATSSLVVAGGASGSVAITDAATGMPVTVLEGAQGSIGFVRFDLSSRRVAASSWDGTVRIWDAGHPYRRWTAPSMAGECGVATAADPDRRFVAVGCGDHATRIWDTARGELLAELPSVTPVDGDFASAFPAVSAAGDLAAIARGNTVELYALPGGKLVRSITHPAAVNAVVFASAGHDLVSGGVDGSLRVTRDGRPPIVLATSIGGIDAASFLSDGRVVATTKALRMRVYDTARGAVLADVALPTRVGLLRSSPDGDRLVTLPYGITGDAPVLWSLDRYSPVASLAHVGRVFSARFVAGGEILTVGGDGAVRRWNAVTGRAMQIYRGGARFVADAILDPDRRLVIGGDGAGALLFWDLANGRLLWRLPVYKNPVIAVHFEGTDLVTRGFGGEVSRWTLPPPEAVIE